MRVLVACEFSGVVRRAFRALGHDAYSCDLMPTEDGDSTHHIKGDVLRVLSQGWDLMISHPPCTHLAVSGAKHFHRKEIEQTQALSFVMALMSAPIPRIALENPVSIISSRIRKPDQIIQPWQFGHPQPKTTCLWLKGLPLLVPTKIVSKGEYITYPSGKRLPAWYANLSPKTRAKERSITFSGIADAMAAQWGAEDFG